MTRINTNISSLNAQKSLTRTNVQLQEALTRLSTGLRINVGKANRVLPGYLVRLICDRAQITGNSIGAIALFAHHSLVDVKREVARQVIESLSDFKDDRGRRWSVKEAE